MTHATLSYLQRCELVARKVAEMARKNGSLPVEAAETMKPETWRNAFELAGVTWAPTMVPDVMLCIRGGDRALHGGPDSIPSDRLLMSSNVAPRESESAHAAGEFVRS